MNEILPLALPLFGLILAGYVCGKLKAIPESGLAWMDFFVTYLALPCLLFRVVSRTPIDQLANPRFVVATTLATVCTFGIGAGIAGFFGQARPQERAIAGLISGYSNLGYLGLPLALAVLGKEAAAPLALILCFDNAVLFTLVPLFMSSKPTESNDASASLQRIVFHPFILATVFGGIAAATHVAPPLALDHAMEMLQVATAPCSLFTLGVSVALRPFQRLPAEVPWLVGVKLLVHPGLAFAFVSLFGDVPFLWTEAAVMMAAMPPALNVFTVARQHQRWIEQASSSVLIGTVTSIVTLIVLIWLIKSGLLH